MGSGGRCAAPALLPPLPTKPNLTGLTAQPRRDPQTQWVLAKAMCKHVTPAYILHGDVMRIHA